MEEKNGNKYLIFASTDKSLEVLSKYTEPLDKTKNLIKKINGKPGDYDDYDEIYMKTKFNSDGNLPLNNILKFHNWTIVSKSAFQEDNK